MSLYGRGMSVGRDWGRASNVPPYMELEAFLKRSLRQKGHDTDVQDQIIRDMINSHEIGAEEKMQFNLPLDEVSCELTNSLRDMALTIARKHIPTLDEIPLQKPFRRQPRRSGYFWN